MEDTTGTCRKESKLDDEMKLPLLLDSRRHGSDCPCADDSLLFNPLPAMLISRRGAVGR